MPASRAWETSEVGARLQDLTLAAERQGPAGWANFLLHEMSMPGTPQSRPTNRRIRRAMTNGAVLHFQKPSSAMAKKGEQGTAERKAWPEISPTENQQGITMSTMPPGPPPQPMQPIDTPPGSPPEPVQPIETPPSGPAGPMPTPTPM